MSDLIKSIETLEETKPDLAELPIHALRSMLKDEGIPFKSSHKKTDLIKMLETGKELPVPEKKKAPRYNDLVEKRIKPRAVLPSEIMPQLEAMKERGLTWEIDEDSCCVTFKRDVTTCTNLDVPAFNITQTAQRAFAKVRSNIKNDWS